MARAPFNVLVYLYRKLANGELQYVLLRRSEGWWQAVAGGGEGNETPREAAIRETNEEVGIHEDLPLRELTTVIPVPVAAFEDDHQWNSDLYVIPKYCFGAQLERTTLSLSSEHTEYRWLSYEDAQALLRY